VGLAVAQKVGSDHSQSCHLECARRIDPVATLRDP
jgi:hypothetical protein